MNPLKLLKLPKPIAKASFAVGKFVKKNAPEILLGAGVVTSVAGIVTAVNGTPKAVAAMEAIQNDIDCFEQTPTIGEKLAVYRAHIKDVVAPFALPCALESISLTCFLTSYGVMKKRHAALALAYQALDTAFTQYRMRVINDLGPEKDEYYRTGVINGTCKVVDENTGEVTETEGKVLEETSGSSIYARFFDEHSTDWKKDPSYNVMFLKGKQHEFNNLLISRGYVFLNEVYEELGLPKCAEGQVVGWVNDPEYGECHVDFGITEGYKLARKCREENIYEWAILLDFNVDGPVYEYLNKINERKLAMVIPKPEELRSYSQPKMYPEDE